MKKFLKSRVAAWLFAVLLVGAVHTRLPENEFKAAQNSTVLIETKSGSGSGVVVSRKNGDGKTRLFVWTANHVIADADTATIKQYIRNEGHRVGSKEFTAKVIGRSPEKDCALLWLDAPADAFRAAKFDSGTMRVGAEVLHIGNVLGANFDGSASVGIISQTGVKPNVPGWPWGVVDQMTAQALYGGSGGPVFNRANHCVAGLLVGGLVGSGYISFTPVREIYAYARTSPVFWAVYGNRCPSDSLLDGIAKASLLPPAPAAPSVPALKNKKK